MVASDGLRKTECVDAKRLLAKERRRDQARRKVLAKERNALRPRGKPARKRLLERSPARPHPSLGVELAGQRKPRQRKPE
jgi:hypothetical protein